MNKITDPKFHDYILRQSIISLLPPPVEHEGWRYAWEIDNEKPTVDGRVPVKVSIIATDLVHVLDGARGSGYAWFAEQPHSDAHPWILRWEIDGEQGICNYPLFPQKLIPTRWCEN